MRRMAWVASVCLCLGAVSSCGDTKSDSNGAALGGEAGASAGYAGSSGASDDTCVGYDGRVACCRECLVVDCGDAYTECDYATDWDNDGIGDCWPEFEGVLRCYEDAVVSAGEAFDYDATRSECSPSPSDLVWQATELILCGRGELLGGSGVCDEVCFR